MKCPEDLLALSAAGLLDAAEERQVREHVRDCVACATRLEELAAVAIGLRGLPSPPPPMHLLSAVTRQMAEYADQRQSAMVAAGVSVLAWATGLAGWFALGQVSDMAATIWALWSVGSAVTAVPVAAGLLRRRRMA